MWLLGEATAKRGFMKELLLEMTLEGTLVEQFMAAERTISSEWKPFIQHMSICYM